MKNIFIIMILVLSSCITTKNAKDLSFKLVKATKQSYTLGMARNDGKDSGITHLIYFDNTTGITIKKLWVEGVNIDYVMVKPSETSIRLRAVFYSGTRENIHEDIKEPIEHDGKALLEYVEGEETKYIVIKDFERLAKPKDAN